MRYMSGSAVLTTRSVDIESFGDLDSLPADAASLFAASGDDLFASRAWYRAVLAHAMPSDSGASLLLCRIDSRPIALFPMRVFAEGRALASLTTPYTCLYHPLLASGLDTRTLEQTFAAFARFCRSWPITRIDALPADWPGLKSCMAAIGAAGLTARQFNHFGNWHEPIECRSWEQYLADRPGQLRETIRRKMRRSNRDPDCRFEVITGGDGLAGGIETFEAVYRRSWKEAEPFPDFNASLMREIAPSGLLRLGTLHIGDTAVAVQLWVVENNRATVLKLAHDEDFKPASPGTVLTALMLRRLIDEERVTEIDFGRGDDEYKRGWAALRRQRIGLVLANPWRARGIAFLGRHAIGRARAALRGAT
jgi:CelD/BcsL family acetyltransferase involved in cellulose biosynthesis